MRSLKLLLNIFPVSQAEWKRHTLNAVYSWPQPWILKVIYKIRCTFTDLQYSATMPIPKCMAHSCASASEFPWNYFCIPEALRMHFEKGHIF